MISDDGGISFLTQRFFSEENLETFKKPGRIHTILCFTHPYDRIVVLGSECLLSLHLRTLKPMSMDPFQTSRYGIKWNEEYFCLLDGYAGNTIYIYSIIDEGSRYLSPMRKVRIDNAQGIMKLNTDLLLCSGKDRLHVVNLMKGKRIKTLYDEKTPFRSNCKISKKYSNCFYVSGCDRYGFENSKFVVYLVDYTKPKGEEIVMTFEEEKPNENQTSTNIEVFYNSTRREEIILVQLSPRYQYNNNNNNNNISPVFIFRTGRGEHQSTNKSIRSINIQRYRKGFNLKNQYMLFCCYDGILRIIDIEEETTDENLFPKKSSGSHNNHDIYTCHSERVLDSNEFPLVCIQLLDISFQDERFEVDMIVPQEINNTNLLKIIRISGLQFSVHMGAFLKLDEKERNEFVVTCQDEIFEKENDFHLLKIILKNHSMEFIYKSFLYC